MALKQCNKRQVISNGSLSFILRILNKKYLEFLENQNGRYT